MAAAVTEIAPSRVLCCGNIVCDILVQPVDEFAAGGTTPVSRIEQHMGGNGANTAYTLALMGTPVRLAGQAGMDQAGEFVLQRLAAGAVDTALIGRSSLPTSTTVVLVSSSGQRSFLHLFGCSADATVEPELFAQCGCDHFHLASPFGLPGIRRRKAELLGAARAAGMTVSLDTHWDSLGEWMKDLGPCLPLLDLLFLNEDEARMLTGETDARAAARIIRSAGAPNVILKLGAAGCALYGAGGECAVAGFPVQAVDTTGAGDCFCGGFLAALHRDASFLEAARFANAMGALSVSALGATQGLLNYEGATSWMARFPSF